MGQPPQTPQHIIETRTLHIKEVQVTLDRYIAKGADSWEIRALRDEILSCSREIQRAASRTALGLLEPYIP